MARSKKRTVNLPNHYTQDQRNEACVKALCVASDNDSAYERVTVHSIIVITALTSFTLDT